MEELKVGKKNRPINGPAEDRRMIGIRGMNMRKEEIRREMRMGYEDEALRKE